MPDGYYYRIGENRGPHGTVDVSYGGSDAPMISGEQWQARVARGDFAAGDAGYYAHRALLAAQGGHPETPYGRACREEQEQNAARGGRTGYDWGPVFTPWWWL